MPYSYGLAGDVTGWTHPAGFTITNTISAAQRITEITSTLSDSTHPPVLAQNLTYTPWGALNTLENGCVGTGCTQRQETYSYSNRMQPVMIELGTTSNNSANYCLVYNYYSGSNPASCAVPSPGAGNNGNVMGYWYSDNTNSTLNHTATYAYDNLNRLSTAQAKDLNQNCLWGVSMPTSNGYDRWGNLLNRTVTCGTATTLSRSADAYNHLSGFTYDAAGNVTADGVHTYQWDAEGRASSIDGAFNIHNALGERVYDQVPGGPISIVYDPAGQLMGAIWSWGWNYFLYFQGRMLVDYEADGAHFGHATGLGSVSQYTDWTGTTAQPILFYPWGQVWQNPTGQLGNALHQEFASLPDYDPNLDQYVTQFRRYSPTAGIWLSPDPLAGDVSNPQSLNRYTYVLNNPTTLIDPTGLDCKPGTANCHRPPPCNGMVCADQYYGGSFFEGATSTFFAICLKNGILGYCNQGALASFSAGGNDEFDAIAGAPGTTFTPAGQTQIGSNGRTSTGTGSAGFDAGAWMQAEGYIDYQNSQKPNSAPTTGYGTILVYNFAEGGGNGTFNELLSPFTNPSGTSFLSTIYGKSFLVPGTVNQYTSGLSPFFLSDFRQVIEPAGVVFSNK